MKVVSIVGARPQFIKIAPVSRAIAAARDSGGPRIEDFIVHTGQHYDPGLSDVFFDELDIPKPDARLNIGSGSHAAQTAGMLEGIERVLLEQKPDAVVVYGDTNSTLAGALAASKLGVPIAHVEAGLRSFDRDMPEEINRIVADHTSDLLLAPTGTAMENLSRENLADRAVCVGDVMLDAMRFNSAIARERSNIMDRLQVEDAAFAVMTIHRAANTDSDRLPGLLAIANSLADAFLPIVFPIHPRTAAKISADCPDWTPHDRLFVVPPVGYLDMIRLLECARVAITDSGGLQKEAFFAGTPCVTLRDETEWIETVEAGANVLVGADSEAAHAALQSIMSESTVPRERLSSLAAGYFGHGRASEEIVSELSKLA